MAASLLVVGPAPAALAADRQPITGTVTIAGTPVTNGTAVLFASQDSEWNPVANAPIGAEGATPGTYSLDVPTDIPDEEPVVVGYIATGGRIEFYNDKPTPQAADPLQPGAVADADLVAQTPITGKVTAGGQPVESVSVSLLKEQGDASPAAVATVFTAPDGSYTIYPPGWYAPTEQFYLRFAKPGLATEYFDNKPGTQDQPTIRDYVNEQPDQNDATYTIPAGATPVSEGAKADADLDTAGKISGTITAEGKTAEDVLVRLWRKDAAGQWQIYDTTRTGGGPDASQYTLYLPDSTESYLVSAEQITEDLDYPQRYYPNTLDLGSATPLNAGATANIDLKLAAAITGTVKGKGAPLQGASVIGFRDNGSGLEVVGRATTGADGKYTLRVGVGATIVTFSANGYTAQLFDNAPQLDKATTIDVVDNPAAGSPQTKVDADLAAGASWRGSTGVDLEAIKKRLNGQGVRVTDLQAIGDQEAFGTFTRASSLSTAAGLVLSSGKVSDLASLNGEVISTEFGTPGDADLDKLVAPQKTFDASAFIVKFVPNSDSVTMRFLVGSDEYTKDGKAGEYSDPMAILVNGKNCAVVPGTDQPISPSTVNADTNSTFFFNNTVTLQTLGLALRGYTQLLTCTADVKANQENTVKIAVADAQDESVDTAVFISESSLRANFTVPPNNVLLLGPSTTWRYNNSGTNLGTDWKNLDYNSASWPSGLPDFGHEQPVTTDIGPTHPTAYFRGEFDVSDPANLKDLKLRMYRDDGAVVYLNGTEVARSNMPSGADTYNTYATEVDPWNGQQELTFDLPSNLLKAGKNVLAVSLHQAGNPSWISGDSRFEAFLTATTVRNVPASPTDAAATAGNASATVTWKAPGSDGGSPITGYTVKSLPEGKTCTTTGALTCTVNGLTNGTAYSFTVTATNDLGSSLPSSPSIPVIPLQPVVAPGAPTGVSAVPGDSTAVVSWQAPTSDGGSAALTYLVTASPGGKTCTTSGELSCTIEGLTNGTAYTFTVTATNAGGTSPASQPSAAVTPGTAPGAPTAVEAFAGAGEAAVSWQAPSNDGGSKVTGYTVTSSPGALTCTTDGELQCKVPGLTNGTSYTFTVTATSAIGTSEPSAPSAAVVPSTVPAAPSNVVAVAGDASAEVTWTVPTNDGGTPITGYVAASRPSGKTCTAGPDETTCTVKGLENGTNYAFTVTAVNAAGTSAPSQISLPVTPSAVVSGEFLGADSTWRYLNDGSDPGATWRDLGFNDALWATGKPVFGHGESGLTTDIGPTTTVAYFRGAFNVPEGAKFSALALRVSADDGVVVWLNGTEVLRSNVASGAITNITSAAAVDSWDGQQQIAVQIPPTLLKPGENILAVSLHQATSPGWISGDSRFEAFLDGTVSDGKAEAPGAPQSVTATAADASAQVSWAAPSNDGGSPITAYTVTSAPDGRTCSTDGALTCTVEGLANGTAYTFTVVATNAVGNSPASKASAPLTPATVPGAPTGVQAEAGDATAQVSWTAPAANGGSTITGYTATAQPGGASCTTTGALTCQVAALTNGTSYTFTVTASNAVGTGPASEASKPVVPDAVSGDLLTNESTWRYDNSGTDLGTAWREVGYDASAWKTGKPLFGHDQPGITTDIGVTQPTAYFRGSFTVASPDNFRSLELTLRADDAAAVYLNGTEVARENLPGGSITFPIFAIETDPYDGGREITYDIPPTLLKAGENVLAVELHQSGNPGWISGDSTFGATLTGVVRPPGVVTIPGAPTSATAAAGDGTATVTWAAPKDDGGANITGYKVTANPGGATCTTTGPLSCTVSGLTNGTAYTFTVVAINSKGQGQPSSPTAAVTPRASAEPPGAPTGVKAQAGDSQASVTWSAPSSNGGSAITGYIATSSPGGKTCEVGGSETSCSVGGLSNGTSYTFTVQAKNSAGTGPASSASNGVTPQGASGPAGWKVFFQDDFNGTSLDSSRWTAYDPANGNQRYGDADPNTEHCLTAKNVTVSGGYLRIRSSKERKTCKPNLVTDYTSGFIGSKQSNAFYPIYARYEIRARMPYGQGLFPALWLRHINGASSAEVDIHETFFNSDPGASTSTVHFPKTLGENIAKKGVFLGRPETNAIQGDWHTWAVDIEEVTPGDKSKAKFTFYIDNKEILSYTNTNASQWTNVSDPKRGFDIAINVAMGQTDVGPTSKDLGYLYRGGGRCALERPQVSTSNPASCDNERTKGRWYNDTITSAPAPDGVPDIWLAPWTRQSGASTEMQVDYVKVYTR